MSEKLDGIRGCWSGMMLYTRDGNALYPPDWFVKCDSNFRLICRWMESYSEGVVCFKPPPASYRPPKDPRWKKVVYKVFNIPSLGNLPFEKRLKRMNELGKEKRANIAIVEHCKCKGRKHIKEEMEKILANEGEGLMIREPGSKYEFCRSRTLLKVKKFWDAEEQSNPFHLEKPNRRMRKLPTGEGRPIWTSKILS